MKLIFLSFFLVFGIQLLGQAKKYTKKPATTQKQKTVSSKPKSSNADDNDIRGYYSNKDSRYDDKPLSPELNPYSIVISKQSYELKVYDSLGWLATYPVVFGSKDQSDKMYQGDKRTPYGKFKVKFKKYSAKWGPLLMLDYPLPADKQRFEERKAKGLIPKNKRLGGDIAIHATRKNEEWTVDHYYNWTDGCISVKFSEMVELFDLIPVGTPVTIED